MGDFCFLSLLNLRMSDVSVAFSICIMLMLWNSRDCGWTLSWLDNRKGSYRVFTSKSTNIPSALNWRFFKGWQFSYIYIRSLVAVKEHTENGTPILGFCYLRSSTSWISSSNIWWRLSIYMLFNTKQCNSGMMYNSACSRWELHARVWGMVGFQTVCHFFYLCADKESQQ